MPAAGTLIDGKYRILSKLKEGGMASIYKVHHDLLDEIRVIKIMRRAADDDTDLQRRFAREARLFTRLRHPNIAAIHDFATDSDGTAYIVMEYIDGLNLADLLRVKGRMEPSTVLEVGRQSLAALDYLHRKQIVHRDISPENILVTQDEDHGTVVKLIDLGIAKALNEQGGETRAGVFLGKFRYSSPEQLAPGEQPIDGRSDLYSLGIVLYELMTGQSPIRGKTASQLMFSHLHDPPTPFADSDPQGHVPEDVRRLILKSLEKEPADRFASAADFAAAIELLQDRYPPAMIEDETKITSSRKLFIAPAPLSHSEQADIDRHFKAVPTPIPTGSGRRLVDQEGDETRSVRDRKTPQPSRRNHPRVLAVAGIGGVLIAIALAVMLGRTLGPYLERFRTASRPESNRAGDRSSPRPAAPTSIPDAQTTAGGTGTAAAGSADPSQEAVATARAQAADSRSSADAAKASVLAPALYREAIARQQNGDLLATTNPLLANQAYLDAAELFRGARDIARAETELLQQRKELERRAREREGSDARGGSEPTSSERRAADEYQVRVTLGRYTAAQQALDADAFVRVYPASDRERVAKAFSSLRSQTVKLELSVLRVAGSRADVTAVESRTAVPRRGSTQKSEAERRFTLEKRNGEWVITSVR